MNINQFGKFTGLDINPAFMPNKDLKTETEESVNNVQKITVEYKPEAPAEK